jgi:tetratricopeptide (TPR) repeat protein
MDKEKLISDLKKALDSSNFAALEPLAKSAVENYPTEAFGYAYLADFFGSKEQLNYKKAQTCIAKACELSPQNASYFVKFANLKEEQYLYEDARVLYLKALNADENNFEALKNMGLYELRVSRMLDKAKDYLTKAQTIQSEDKLVNLHLAELYYEQKNLEDALISINLALDNTFDESTTVLLIKILFALGNHKNGLKVYDSLVTKRPENIGYRFDFAQKLYNAKVYGEAATQLKKAMDMSTEDVPESFVDLYVKSLTMNGKEAEAIAALDQVIKENPDNFIYYNLRANAYLFTKNVPKAIQDLKEIIRLLNDSNLNFEYREKLGFLLLKNDETEAAKAIFEEMTANTIQAKVGLYGLGIIAFSQDDFALSYHFLKKAKLKGNTDAEKFIYQKLNNYLKELKDKAIAANAKHLAANTASPMIQNLSGKLWCFDSLDSKALSAQPENVYNSIVKSLQSSSFVITNTGTLMVKSVHAEATIFSIIEESEALIKLACTVLDGSRKHETTIRLQSNNQIIVSEQEGVSLHFKATDLDKIPLAVLKAYNRTLIPEEISFLGKDIETISNAFFKPA